jgi:hypothetical protein
LLPVLLLLLEPLDKSIVRASIVLNQMRIHLSLVFHTAHSVPSCSTRSTIILYAHQHIWLALFVPGAQQRAEAAAAAAARHHHSIISPLSFEHIYTRQSHSLVYRLR